MTCIGYIGLGLIGGSVARSVRKFHPDWKQVAYSRTPSTTESAISDGVIDAIRRDAPFHLVGTLDRSEKKRPR